MQVDATSNLHPDKLESQKQWDTDSCGAETAGNEQPGTRAFYRTIRDHRYRVYAPWLDEAMRFESWAGKRVQEIGVGVGSDHYRLASVGCQMTGLDLSLEHLRHTLRHLELEGLKTVPVHGDAESIPFADSSFDLVYSFGVLHHTPDTERAIAEVFRVLRPGGTALIGLYHRDSLFFWVSTVIQNGLLRGRLFRRGWRRLMSEIEYRRDGASALPLVKTYSRRQVRRLFGRFNQVAVRAHHVEPSHFSVARPIFRRIHRMQLEEWFGYLGWYVVAEATKAP